MNTREAYAILNLKAGVTHVDIKKQYRKLSKQLHPDNQKTGNEPLYKQVQAAYEYLRPRGTQPKVTSTTTQAKTQNWSYTAPTYTHSNIFGDVIRK